MNIRNRKTFRNPQSAIRNRKGILLLVVLSMLTLFLLIGTAFIVSANHYRRAQKALARATEATNSSTKTGDLLDEVLNQLVRDTNNQYSSLRFHSLLRDLYGSDGLEIGPSTTPTVRFAAHSGFTYTHLNALGNNVTVNQASLNDAMLTTGNQFFWVAVEILVPAAPLLPPISTIDNYYNGRLMSFHDGDLAGTTARVIDYVYRVDVGSAVPDRAVAVFTLLPLVADEPIVSSNLSLNDTHTALINGQPFNGTGFGFNRRATTGARLDADEVVAGTNRKLALMPNSTFLDPQQVNGSNGLALLEYFLTDGELSYLADNPDNLTPEQLRRYQEDRLALRGIAGLGGSDESYDAVDFQNMALALMPVDPDEFGNPATMTLVNATSGKLVPIPSFHRPALINYWNSAGIATEPNLLRKVLLRPNWWDHPSFTGSNPSLAQAVSAFETALATNGDTATPAGELLQNMIYGPWDVDNDNDGIRDSVWVDFGAPVMTRADGTRVKPLAALLVVDLDGRLNVNAHGSIEHASGNDPVPQVLAGGVQSRQLPEGAGYGTADISLNSIFPQTLDLTQLIRGTVDLPGRYGWDIAPIDMSRRAPGLRQKKDLATQLDRQGLPRHMADPEFGLALTAIERRSAYGSPPDLHGRYALGLNDFGQPVHEALDLFSNPGSIFGDGIKLDEDTPYEMDLSLFGPRGENPSSVDTPYSLGELERVLRSYDVDAPALPPRLWELGDFANPSLPDNVLRRNLLTTDSYDLPVPNVVVPSWMVVGRDNMANTDDDYAIRMGKPPTNATFADLLEYRVRDELGIVKATETPAQLAQVQQQLRVLLPRDLADGLRLDINRPFGNGRDDNFNGVVDEPGEWDDLDGDGVLDPDEREGSYWAMDMTRAADFVPVDTSRTDVFEQNKDGADLGRGSIRDDVDRNGDGVIENWERGDHLPDNNGDGIPNSGDGDGTMSPAEMAQLHNYRRQMLAKDLYVLAMLLADPLPAKPPPTPDEKKRRARRLAQWAINAVDFRDVDNCMTPFEYDANPFDGWSPDGDPLTIADRVGIDGIPGNDDDEELLWGAEPPELLITETLAWHDRRTEDTSNEGTVSLDEPEPGNPEKGDVNSGKDASYDQREKPQGFAFIEIYNPAPVNPSASADTHMIDNVGNDPRIDPGIDLGIDLARTHDDDPTNRDPINDPLTGSPVWRLMVYKNGGFDKNPDDPDPNNRPYNTVPGDSLAHRSVYFSGRDPSYNDNGADGVAYFNDVTNLVPPVRPGRYMVIGAGEDQGGGDYFAKFGDTTGTRTGTARGVMLKTDLTAPDAVALHGVSGDANGGVTGKVIRDSAGFAVETPAEPNNAAILPRIPGDTSASTASVAIIDRPTRFSLSEPPGGYPDNVVVNSATPASNSRWNGTQYVPILDVPLDDVSQRQLRGGGGGIGGGRRGAVNKLLQDGETRLALPLDDKGQRTIPGFSWIYLQRLANPLLPWNPPAGEAGHDANLAVNPYMTIDSMGANVTVFNGLSADEKRWPTGVDRSATNPLRFANNSAVQNFASLQRGRSNNYRTPVGKTLDERRQDLANHQERVQLGKPLPGADPAAAASDVASLWTRENTASLYSNKAGMLGDGTDSGDRSHYFNGIPDCTLGFMNEPFRDGAATNPQLSPMQPFPLLSTNNRPYISGNELLLVPAYGTAELLQAFSYRNSAANVENYVAEDGVTELSDTLGIDGPFGQLLNFFRSEYGGVEGGAPTQENGIPGVYRLLDYVHVPSKFVGTQTWLNPATFGRELATIGATPDLDPTDPRHLLQPPFNRVSAFRDPGRVNLNTIFDEKVYNGLMHGAAAGSVLPTATGQVHPGPKWQQLFGARREILKRPIPPPRRIGTGAAVGAGVVNQVAGVNLLELDPDFPTFFETPFRSPDANDLVPLLTMVHDYGGVHCTMLRGTSSSGTNVEPLFVSQSTQAYNNANRNAMFRYQPMTRLDNLTTTRSNVFAVWITIGFFEVEEFDDTNAAHRAILMRFGTGAGTLVDAQVDPLFQRVYPEGYLFGKEAGSETGEIERLREFAVVDRTIPVAFEPGENHNVDLAIPLRRRIE